MDKNNIYDIAGKVFDSLEMGRKITTIELCRLMPITIYPRQRSTVNAVLSRGIKIGYTRRIGMKGNYTVYKKTAQRPEELWKKRVVKGKITSADLGEAVLQIISIANQTRIEMEEKDKTIEEITRKYKNLVEKNDRLRERITIQDKKINELNDLLGIKPAKADRKKTRDPRWWRHYQETKKNDLLGIKPAKAGRKKTREPKWWVHYQEAKKK
jgi:polyhydroxyalkanoate synthesis regulator phasin